jgi:acyl carrier protein
MTNKIQIKINEIIFDTVGVDIFTELEKPDDIRPEHDVLKDLAGDFIDWMEIVDALEEEFLINIPEFISKEWQTVRDIHNYFSEYHIDLIIEGSA